MNNAKHQTKKKKEENYWKVVPPSTLKGKVYYKQYILIYKLKLTAFWWTKPE